MNRFFKGIASISLIGTAGAAVSGSVGCAKEVGKDVLFLRSGKEFVKSMRNLIDSFNDSTKKNFKVAVNDFFPLLDWSEEVLSRKEDRDMINKIKFVSDIVERTCKRNIPELDRGEIPNVVVDYVKSCEKEYKASHPRI